MKLLLATILTVALIVIGYYIYKTGKEKKKIARTVGRIMLTGWLIVLFNLISLVTRYESVCSIAYSFYFIASNWMLYYLFRFSIDYLGYHFERHINRPVLITVLILDSLSVLLNSVFGHLFELRHVEMFGGESYYELAVRPLFYVHYIPSEIFFLHYVTPTITRLYLLTVSISWTRFFKNKNTQTTV